MKNLLNYQEHKAGNQQRELPESQKILNIFGSSRNFVDSNGAEKHSQQPYFYTEENQKLAETSLGKSKFRVC